MANEITVSGSLAVSKNSIAQSLSRIGLSVTQSGDDSIKQTQVIGTTEEAITLNSDASTLGWCLIINRDSTNFVKIRSGTGGTDMIKIKAGEFALFRWMTGLTPYAIADTAACRIEILHIED